MTLLPIVLIALMLMGEIPTFRRQRKEARAAKKDSAVFLTAAMCLVFGGSFALANWASALELRQFPAWIEWAAVTVFVFGLVIRLWAVATLGRFFTRSVQVSPDQPVVQTGPYRWVRHPSYTGVIFEGLGIGLALGNPLSLAVLVIPMWLGFGYRIRVEEGALAAVIGEPYRTYSAKTKRLIPFIF